MSVVSPRSTVMYGPGGVKVRLPLVEEAERPEDFGRLWVHGDNCGPVRKAELIRGPGQYTEMVISLESGWILTREYIEAEWRKVME